MDYTHTTFPDHSFDVIWGVESICHAFDKRLFIKEAFRLLKPKGRLIIADGFANPSIQTAQDQIKMNAWLKRWGIDALAQASYFEKGLQEEGFTHINFEDVTVHVIPSSRRLYWISLFAWPFSMIGELLGWRTASQTDNLYGARCQYTTLKKKLWHYGIFYAEKSG
jgi:tocopherol O-methyltransferase